MIDNMNTIEIVSIYFTLNFEVFIETHRQFAFFQLKDNNKQV